MSKTMNGVKMTEWMSAKDVARAVGRTSGWLYYHSRSSTGPIQRKWGVRKDKRGNDYNIVLFNATDVIYFAKWYSPGANTGKLYPSSVVEQVATPDEWRRIENEGMRPLVTRFIQELLQQKDSGNLQQVA